MMWRRERETAMKRRSLIVLAALVPSAAWAADFSGTWRITNVFNGNPGIITCAIAQAGDTLSGTCKPEIPGIEPSALAGSVTGNSAKWGYDVVFNGNQARVDYTADLASDGTLKGNVLRNGSPSPMTAVKQ
jgi:hypothetical protein